MATTPDPGSILTATPTPNEFPPLDGPSVTFSIRPSQKQWTIPKSVLSKAIYFHSDMRSLFVGGIAPRTITKPDIDEDSFEVYVNWLYTDQIVYPRAIRDKIRELKVYQLLFAAYSFGDKIRHVAFKDKVIDRLVEVAEESKAKTFPGVALIHHVYDHEGDTNNAMLKRWIADHYVCHASNATWRRLLKNTDKLPNRFALDLLPAFVARRQEAPTVVKLKSTDYHHKPGNDPSIPQVIED